MKKLLAEKIVEFAQSLPAPLYVVGGFVRNFLIDGKPSKDVDLASPMGTDTLVELAEKFGIKVVAHYKRVHTVVLQIEKQKYEFTSFRKEEYENGGAHAPSHASLTSDIMEDATRRDFKCNAIYYDVKDGRFVDPLGGIEDVKNKTLDTVVSPDLVFEHDGLRLMRLARFAGELGFTPTDSVLKSARKNAKNVNDISAERVYAELTDMLVADKKHDFSPKDGHYRALKVLDSTRVLDEILPELTLGRGMAQRSDFHNYDVLEHTLKSVMYAHHSVRLPALLHDVGKPKRMIEYGKYHSHDVEGKILARKILARLKAPVVVARETEFLVGAHMLDLKCDMRENKVRLFIVENYGYIDKLLKLKTADYNACKDAKGEPESVIKWKEIIKKMKADGTPFCIKDLKLSATELMALGFTGKEIGETLKRLFRHAVLTPSDNKKEKLVKLAYSRNGVDK